MPKFVRVRLPNGEASMTARAAEAAGLKPLDKPGAGRDGRPLPFKPRVPKGGAVAAEPPSIEADASESQED
jgi:hypothetical protein